MADETNKFESKSRLMEGNPALRTGVKSLRVYRSVDLLGKDQEVLIEHDSEQYRLRCTSKGKLILTK